MIALLILSSSLTLAICGDGTCQGRSSWDSSDYGLSENFDSCPSDCSIDYQSREINKPYHTYAQMESMLKDLAQRHGGSWEVAGHTVQGREILLFKFGNPDGGVFMFDGRLHGPEDCGSEAGLLFLRWVLESSDSKAKLVRDGTLLLFMPGVNRDSDLSRQNQRRFNSDGTFVPYGVDLNRNFPEGWGLTGSTNPGDPDNYIGEAPGSEPETEAVIKVFHDYRPQVYVNVHCGQFHLSGAGNQAVSHKILGLIENESRMIGSKTQETYNPHVYASSCGSGGYVRAEACKRGASAWLFEVSEWQRLPSTIQGFADRWWPEAFPVYLSMAESVMLSNSSGPDSDLIPQNQTSEEPIIEPQAPEDPPVTPDLPDSPDAPNGPAMRQESTVLNLSDRGEHGIGIFIQNMVLPIQLLAAWGGVILLVFGIGMAFSMMGRGGFR